MTRISTDDKLAAYLYRVDDGDGHFYSSMRTVQAAPNVELVGVATRYRGDQFHGAESRGEFVSNLSKLAVDTYLFDDPMPTDGLIAEFLYRTPWSEDRYLHAATRQEVEFTDHDIIGVVARPPRETVDSTKWGREEFVENVDAVAESVRWFDLEDEDA